MKIGFIKLTSVNKELGNVYVNPTHIVIIKAGKVPGRRAERETYVYTLHDKPLAVTETQEEILQLIDNLS